MNHLTPFERMLLNVLLARRGQVVPRRELERTLYPAGRPRSNTLEVFVGRLREKTVDTFIIKTVRDIGYQIDLAPYPVEPS